MTEAVCLAPTGTDVPALVPAPGARGAPGVLVDPDLVRESRGPETGHAPSAQGQGLSYVAGRRPSCPGHRHQPRISQFPEVWLIFTIVVEYSHVTITSCCLL